MRREVDKTNRKIGFSPIACLCGENLLWCLLLTPLCISSTFSVSLFVCQMLCVCECDLSGLSFDLTIAAVVVCLFVSLRKTKQSDKCSMFFLNAFPPLPPLFKKVIPRCRLFLLLSSPLFAANLAVLSSLMRVIICTNSLSSSPSPLVYFNSISRTRILNVNQQCCAN